MTQRHALLTNLCEWIAMNSVSSLLHDTLVRKIFYSRVYPFATANTQAKNTRFDR